MQFHPILNVVRKSICGENHNSQHICPLNALHKTFLQVERNNFEMTYAAVDLAQEADFDEIKALASAISVTKVHTLSSSVDAKSTSKRRAHSGA